jgi:hypothetical protein
VADEEAPDEDPAPRRARRPRGDGEKPSSRPARNGRTLSASVAARKAAEEVAAFTGSQPETVISIERSDDGWEIGIEVVETHRIPDSADILASYEVRLESDGELASYRRTGRYARGRLQGDGR